MFDQVSVHGIIHGIFGAVVFSLAPVTCFVFHRRMRTDPALQALAPWTLAAGILLVVGIVLLKVSQLPGGLFPYKGLVQRAVLLVFMTWLLALGATVRTRLTGPTRLSGSSRTSAGPTAGEH